MKYCRSLHRAIEHYEHANEETVIVIGSTCSSVIRTFNKKWKRWFVFISRWAIETRTKASTQATIRNLQTLTYLLLLTQIVWFLDNFLWNQNKATVLLGDTLKSMDSMNDSYRIKTCYITVKVSICVVSEKYIDADIYTN